MEAEKSRKTALEAFTLQGVPAFPGYTCHFVLPDSVLESDTKWKI